MKPRPGDFSMGWDIPDYLRTGVSGFFMFQQAPPNAAEEQRKLDNNVKRFNNHQLSKNPIGQALAQQIQQDMEEKSKEKGIKLPSDHIGLTIADSGRRHTEDHVMAESVRVTQRFIQRAEDKVRDDGLINLSAIARRVVTDAKPLRLMQGLPQPGPKPAEKRLVGDTTAEPPAKRTVRLQSLSGVQTFEDMLDSRKDFWRRERGAGDDGKVFQRDFISARHVANLLWQPYNDKQTVCCNSLTGMCRAQLDPGLQHPLLKSTGCMAYLSPLQYDALSGGEPLDPHAFTDRLCIFCNRYQILHTVLADTAKRTNAIGEELPTYYYRVNSVGEYDSAGCIQEHSDKNAQSLHGILGPVVVYNTAHFQPVVGIVGANDWEITKVFTLEEYERKKSVLNSHPLAFGWEETGPFYRLNHNALPVVPQVSPYEIRYTRIENGPFSAALVLEGYFGQRDSTKNYGHVFWDLRRALADPDFLDRPSPLCAPERLKQLEAKNLLFDPGANRLFQRYFIWSPIAMHQPAQSPAYETSRVYYTFLYIINGIHALREEYGKILPPSLKKKFKIILAAYEPMRRHFQETADLSDETLERPVFFPPLQQNVSTFFTVYPRPAKLSCRVEDFEYLSYEVRVLTKPKPDAVLRQHYLNREVGLLHSVEMLDQARNTEDLFPPIYLARSGAYTAATEKFHFLHNQLRRYVFVRWPVNSIASFAPAGTQPVSEESTEMIRRKSLREHAETLVRNMKHAYTEVLFHMEMENAQYRSLISYIEQATMEFGRTVEWVQQILGHDRGIGRFLAMLGIEDFNQLLPAGFTADINGVNGDRWQKNTYLLAALFRVHVLERLYALEAPVNAGIRQQLLLLSHSHFDLIRCICERGPYVLVRDDHFLENNSVLPSALVKAQFQAGYVPVTSMLRACWPRPDRAFHPGSVPNIAHALVYVNFFAEDDNAKEIFRLQHLVKHRANMRFAVFKALKGIFGEARDNFSTCIERMLEMSWKGLWAHCTVSPGFRVSMQLDSIFRNTDRQDARRTLDEFINAYIKHGECEKITCMHLFNDSIVEAISTQAACVGPLQQTLREVYGTDIFQRSVGAMEAARLVLAREESFDLRRLAQVSTRLSLEYTQKVCNLQKPSFVKFMCMVILASDEERHATNRMLRAHHQLQPCHQERIESFIRKLHPRGVLYAEDLVVVGMTDATIQFLSNLEDRMDSGIEIATVEYMRLPLLQYNVVGYFFAFLDCYLAYSPLRILNTAVLDAQEKSIRRVSSSAANASLTTATISLCCHQWNKFPPSKQFPKKILNADGVPSYEVTLGSQSIQYDPVADKILCGSNSTLPAKRGGQQAKRRAQRIWEMENGIIPPDIHEEFRVIRRPNKVAKSQSSARTTQQRRLEGRIPNCQRCEVLQVNLEGRLVQCPPMKVPKEKKKKVQKLDLEQKRRQDKIRISPITRATFLDVSKPPFWIAPCCGLISGYNFSAWGPNGYVCGACLPKSNHEKALQTEILCMSCASVVSNRPMFKTCTQPECENPGKTTVCKHAATPILLLDDVYENQMRYLYFCDVCFRKYRQVSPTTLLSLSSIKAQSLDMINRITREK
jgi:hypothetical protein